LIFACLHLHNIDHYSITHPVLVNVTHAGWLANVILSRNAGLFALYRVFHAWQSYKWLCVCLCMSLYNVFVLANRSFSTSLDQVHGTCEQNHTDQIILHNCTGLCTVVK
jgi:hypothetical protein